METWSYEHLLNDGYYAVHLHDAAVPAVESTTAPQGKAKVIACNLDTPDEEENLISLYAYLRVLAEAKVTTPDPGIGVRPRAWLLRQPRVCHLGQSWP